MPIQLDLSDTETFQPVLNFLKHHFPSSLLHWQLLTYLQQNIVKPNDIYPELFVDNPKEITCSILLYSSPGLPDAAAVKNYSRNVVIACEKAYVEDALTPMLEKCIPWNQELIFCAIESEYIKPSIDRFVQTKQLGNIEVVTFYQVESDKEAFDRVKPDVLPIPKGYEIRPLSIEDASLIFDTWFEKATGFYSVPQVQFCIEHLPNFGAYRDDKLVAWRLIMYDGSTDMVFTLPEDRSLGLSHLLNIRLTDETFKIQPRIFAHIDPDNKASLNLAIKGGCQMTCTIHWLYFQPNSSHNEKTLSDDDGK